ncbi:uncharacterized protein LOC123314311 [Coccinella septempunctata]|uniref:uncharacterized protein LOC123314311 n=1 Tax=Coccinella septempunctata TaxID=41139 RepID=UPI001D072FFC|nr:uncharacterized protein LOC123314311 [Coccinella septempunctata]
MERFGDDMSLNKLFVKEVEKRRCLYDYTFQDYSNKDLQDRSWQEIADVVGSTVHECKSRWKNLRAGLTRYLSRPLTLSGARYVKKYYLFDDLQFILPFIRARHRTAMNDGADLDQSDGNPHVAENDEEVSQDVDMDIKPHILLDDLESNSDDYTHFFEQNLRQKKRKPVHNNHHMEEVPRVKVPRKTVQNDDVLDLLKNCVSESPRESNPDLDFFRSILPDIADFTPVQKRLFKRKVLQVIDEIACT